MCLLLSVYVLGRLLAMREEGCAVCAVFGVSLYMCVRGCDACAICLCVAVRVWVTCVVVAQRLRCHALYQSLCRAWNAEHVQRVWNFDTIRFCALSIIAALAASFHT
jgi:hypothetical protein